MRTRWKILALVAISCLGGCGDFTSPQGVIKTAYQALKSDDSGAFRDTLTGLAREQYGHLDGMLKVQQRIQGYTVYPGQVELLESVQGPFAWEMTETYLAEVRGNALEGSERNALLMTTKVKCRIHYRRRGPDDWFPAPPFPPGWSSSEPYLQVETLDCRIDDIQL